MEKTGDEAALASKDHYMLIEAGRLADGKRASWEKFRTSTSAARKLLSVEDSAQQFRLLESPRLDCS
jgi:hypothetical protein